MSILPRNWSGTRYLWCWRCDILTTKHQSISWGSKMKSCECYGVSNHRKLDCFCLLFISLSHNEKAYSFIGILHNQTECYRNHCCWLYTIHLFIYLYLPIVSLSGVIHIRLYLIHWWNLKHVSFALFVALVNMIILILYFRAYKFLHWTKNRNTHVFGASILLRFLYCYQHDPWTSYSAK